MQASNGFDPPPPPFRRTPSGAVELRQGGGCLGLFGLPFFLAGVFLLLGSLGIVRVKDEFQRPLTGRVPAAAGLVFLAAGGGLLFGRRSVIFDVPIGSITRRFSAIAPLRTEHRSLAEFNAIVIGFQVGDSESVDRYPVRLRAIAGKDFTISSPAQFAESRTQAEYLARLLRLPMTDVTTEHEVILAPERAGETLQQRLKGATVETPPAHASMRSSIDQSGGETTIVIPRRTSLAGGVISAVVGSVGLIIVAPTLWRLLSTPGAPFNARLPFLGFILFFFGVLPLASAAAAFGLIRGKIVVRASISGLVIERGAGRARTETILAADILDIDYSTMQGIVESTRRSVAGPNKPPVQGPALTLLKHLPNKGVIVKCRSGLITFGEGLPAEELGFLVWTLKRSLAGLPADRV